ncbi:hypothetical protein AAX26_01164 [Aliarcobacter thereius]|uniref:hypothetical protein n=1 Tax=Aliarcobacter thereius TaxID=544718 RepID=UPI0008240E32|nr:hypothetical protein [Aliarcobacter thereius]OCL86858.1 hypothetical protein AAX26_01164 [Aliarcobacter thereius]OCL90911.1 hypothetical protein AAX25_01079 [Aliarcobacter thereius]
MQQIALYLLGLIGFKALRKSVVIVMAVSVVSMIIAFYAFSITMLIEVYNLTNQLLDLSFTNDGVFSYFMDVSSSIGLVDGFKNGMPFIFSSLIFVLLKILFNHTFEVLRIIFYVVNSTLE